MESVVEVFLALRAGLEIGEVGVDLLVEATHLVGGEELFKDHATVSLDDGLDLSRAGVGRKPDEFGFGLLNGLGHDNSRKVWVGGPSMWSNDSII